MATHWKPPTRWERFCRRFPLQYRWEAWVPAWCEDGHYAEGRTYRLMLADCARSQGHDRKLRACRIVSLRLPGQRFLKYGGKHRTLTV